MKRLNLYVLVAGMALVGLLGGLASPSWAQTAAAPPSPAAGAGVSLTIDYGNGVEKTLTAIPWREGLTAWEATLEATRRQPQSQVNHTGKGPRVFVTEIDGFKNQGGGAEKKNWQYWVNGTYANEGAGAKVLKAGDKVLWKFALPPPGMGG